MIPPQDTVAVPAYPPPAIAESHHRALRAHQELLEQIGRLQESNCDLIRECNAHGERLSAKDKEIQALQQEKAELECRINRLQSDNVELQEKAIKDSTKMLAVQLQEEKMRESLVLMQNVNKNLLGRNAALEHHIKSLPQPSTTPSRGDDVERSVESRSMYDIEISTQLFSHTTGIFQALPTKVTHSRDKPDQIPTDTNFDDAMSKSKNHTNHNQNKKAHRNGIKKPKSGRTRSLKGVDAKFRRNARHALAGARKARAEAKAES
ncbi:hypothetical protein ONZ45_g16175 [Pleurotus djamor]|nr:hypothetical protein ONZ45_g16175 [Pleurotus djamor]